MNIHHTAIKTFHYLKNTIIKHRFTILLFSIASMLLFSAPTDPDFGWHFKQGEYFFKTLNIGYTNLFSFTMRNYPWADSYWFYEMLSYFLNHNLGVILAPFIPIFLLAGMLLFLSKKVTQDKTSILIWFLTTCVILALFNISVRPLIYSTIFMYYLLYVLLFDKDRRDYLPFLFYIWANMHADFVLGIFVYAVFVVQQIIQKHQWEIKNFAISVLITLVNPFGINLWKTILNEISNFTDPSVKEMLSTFSIKDVNWTLSVAFLILLFLVGGFYMRKHKVYWYDFLLVFFALFGLKTMYMLRIFFILGSIGLLYLLHDVSDYMAARLHHSKFASHMHLSSLIILTYAFFLLLLAFFTFNLSNASSTAAWSNYAKYPHDAVNYIKQKKISGNIFNSYDWGGYLVWQTPSVKTFIDGRMTKWNERGGYIMNDYKKIVHEPQKNNDLFSKYISKYNIEYILLKPDSKLVTYLTSQENSGWEAVFYGQTAVLLQKK